MVAGTGALGIRATVYGLAEFRRATQMMQNDINAVARAATGLASTSWTAGQRLQAVGTAMASIGRSLTFAVTAPIILAGEEMIRTAIIFEDAFADIGKTVEGVADEFGVLTEVGMQVQEEFREMARTIPISFDELSELGGIAGQLGLQAEDVAEFTRVIAEMAVTTDLSAEEGAFALARLGAIFGQSSEEISANAERVASVIVELGNRFASTEDEIVRFSLQIAGQARQLQLSETDVLAWSNAMASLGIQAERGGSAFSRLMYEMNNAIVSGTTGMTVLQQEAGITADEFLALAASSPEQAINRLNDAVNAGGSQLEAFAGAAGMAADDFAEAFRDNAEDALTSITDAMTGGAASLSSFAEVAGMTMDDFVTLYEEDANSAILAVIDGLSELQSQGLLTDTVFQALNLDTIRTRDVMQRLAGNTDLVRDSLSVANAEWEEANALSIEAQRRFGTLRSQIVLLWNNIKDLAFELLERLKPAFESAIDTIIGITDAIREADPAIIDQILNFIAMVAAVGPVVWAVGNFVKILGVLVGSIGPVVAALGPLGLAIGAVIAAVTYVIGTDNIFSAIQLVAQEAMGWVEDVKDAVLGFIDTVLGEGIDFGELFVLPPGLDFLQPIRDDIDWFLGILRELGQPRTMEVDVNVPEGLLLEDLAAIGDGMTTTVDVALSSDAQAFLDVVADFREDPVGFILELYPENVQEAFAELSESLPPIAEDLASISESIAGFMETVAESEGVQTLIENINLLFETFMEYASSGQGLTDFLDGLSGVFDRISLATGSLSEVFGALDITPLTDAFDQIMNIGDQLDPEIVAQFEESWAGVTEAMQPLIDTVITLATAIGGGLVQGLITALGWMISGAATFIPQFIEAMLTMQTGINNVITGVINIFMGLWNFLGALWDYIFVGGSTAVENIRSSLETLVSGVRDLITGLFQYIGGFLWGMFEIFMTVLTAILGLVSGFVVGIIQFFVDLYNNLVGASIIPDMVNAIIQYFTNLWTNVVQIVTNIYNSVVQWFDNLKIRVTSIVQTLRNTIRTIFDEIRRIINRVRDAIQSFIDKWTYLVNQVLYYADQVGSALQNAFGGLLGSPKLKIEYAFRDMESYLRSGSFVAAMQPVVNQTVTLAAGMAVASPTIISTPVAQDQWNINANYSQFQSFASLASDLRAMQIMHGGG